MEVEAKKQIDRNYYVFDVYHGDENRVLVASSVYGEARHLACDEYRKEHNIDGSNFEQNHFVFHLVGIAAIDNSTGEEKIITFREYNLDPDRYTIRGMNHDFYQ